MYCSGVAAGVWKVSVGRLVRTPWCRPVCFSLLRELGHLAQQFLHTKMEPEAYNINLKLLELYLPNQFL